MGAVKSKAGEVLEEVIRRLRYSVPVKGVKALGEGRAVVVVDRRFLRDAVLAFFKAFDGREPQLSSMVGIDESGRLGGDVYSITYWLSLNDGGSSDVLLGIRAYVRGDDPTFPSVADVIYGSNWYEREVRDLLGLKPVGHPDPRRLILPDDWPEGVYPLRKDFPYYESPSTEPKYEFKVVRDANVVPFGPYHVALDEPAHFRLYVRGEEIVEVDYRGFYSHRGIEKIAESRLTYNQVPFIAERICGICGFTHSTAYCQAVEAAAGIEVPERAEFIRTILLEIERIHSHLLWVGVACHLLGFDLGFMHVWRVREHVMWLAERLTGNRKTYGMNLIGGVRRDLLKYRVEAILKTVERVRREFKELVDMLTNTRSFVRRCEGVGVLTNALARKWCVVGPVARASGRKIDVRADHPYAAYGRLSFKVPVRSEGDVLARALVRIEEVFESLNIIEEALDTIPGGEIMADVRDLPEYSEGVGCTEAPRGENVHYVMTGPGNRVYRWRARASTYNNLPAARDMLVGYEVADAPLIVASIDPCYSCTERVIIVDVRRGSAKVLSRGEFERLSIRKSRRCA